ncbi:MAG: hypothetical protein JSR77_02560 [Planctomycetes bacterium]|nr:hypothetical protein [Planctomycetota bacterium]
MKNTKVVVCSAAALCMLAGAAMGQATDGKITNAAERALYGGPRWVNGTTTGFGDASANQGTCDPNTVGGNPALVNKGIEIMIPLSEIGNPTGQIGLCAIVNGGNHDYMSNQVLPTLPFNTSNLGGDGNGNYTGTCAGINFNNFAGTQHVFATPSAGTPAVDGTLDGVYGAPIALQNNRTRFGNANNGQQGANGSELDGLYMCKDATNLYIFISGNLENNFNKFEIFIDSTSGGENTILGDMTSDVDGGAINNRLAGLTFDAGFAPDYMMTWGIGNGITYYPNFADLNANVGSFLGCKDAGDGSGVLTGCGGPPANGIQVAMDNTNTGGVDAPCPPPGANPNVANGSEIDAVYSYIDTATNRLHVLVTGNLENGGGDACGAGGNKLNLFFDPGAGLDIDRDGNGQPDVDTGQNTLLGGGMNVDISYGNLNRMGGLTFDDGFSARYWMSYKTGGDPVYHVLDSAVLRSAGKRANGIGSSFDYGAYDGGTKSAYNPITYRGNFVPCNGNANINDPQSQSGFDANLFTNFGPRAAAESLQLNPAAPVGTPGLIEATIDNSNVGGVQGTGGSVSDAASVETGFELSIDLTELGWDGSSCIKLAGFVTSGDATYGSNQVIGGLPGQDFPNLGNMGNMSTINFNTIEGTQWIVIGGNCCPVCAADYNQDGGVDGSDVAAFFPDWEASATCADVNADGGVDGGDVETFFNLWEAGDANCGR